MVGRRLALVACVLLLAAAGTARAQIPDLTADGQPNVQAAAAIAVDADNGAEYFAKNADDVRAIASTGKIFVALVVRARRLDLDGLTEITRTDVRAARGGARTRLEFRHKFRNVDLLRALLIASDNRAPTALARAVGLDPAGLIAAMNDLAKSMGLTHTHFVGPCGLKENVSTAREMAIALRAALKDPVLAEIMGTKEVEVRSIHSHPRRIHYRNTNKALLRQRFPVIGGKTGYTDPAGYCLILEAKLAGRTVVIAIMGAHEKLTRFGDFNRLARWIEGGGVAAARTADVGTASKGSLTAPESGR